MNGKSGKIILKAISDANSQKKILAYLLKISKNASPDQLSARLGNLPIALINNISEKNAKIITGNLNRLGAIAIFLPNAETAHNTSKAAFPASGQIRSKPPAIPSQTAKKHVLKSAVKAPNKTRRPVRTALLVMLVGSVLTSFLFYYFQYMGGPKNTSTQQTSQLNKSGQSRAPDVTQAKASSVMRHAPETMYTNYIKQYTVPPDRAIIGAFNDLIELYASLKGVPKENITYRKGPVQLKGIEHHGWLIDEAQIKQVFRTLYAGAVSLRFNVLMNRWGVLDRATNYVNAFSNADPEHPLVMSMQIEVQIDSGNRRAADDICEKILLNPQASASIATRAHYFINDELKQIKATPAVVSKMDSHPGNLLNLGLIFSRLDHYDFSEKFYNLGLVQNPYRYDIYARLAHVIGNDKPVLDALDKFADN